MVKSFVIFITSLMVLILFAGCKPGSVEPHQVEPPKAKLAEPQPPKVETPRAELPEPRPPETELPKPEPLEVEQPETKAPEAEPSVVITPEIAPPKVEPPKPEPPKPEPASKVSFHDKCADILTNFVNDKGMVNYKELRRKRLELNHLLDEFNKLDLNEYKSWPKEDKIAFWINAYNLEMLKIIVDNYPIQSTRILRIIWGPDSIRHIDKNIGGIWKSKFMVMDEEFTLEAIQQRFFCKEFDEPRVFFALSFACFSSPPLRNEPYYGHKLDKQLDNQARRFLSRPEAFEIDRENKIVYLSAILKPTWHGKEFVGKYGTDKKFKEQEPATRAVLNSITNYISSQDVSFLEVENYIIEYMGFNWTINDGS